MLDVSLFFGLLVLSELKTDGMESNGVQSQVYFCDLFDYAFCLLTLKSSEKWRSPLFGATCICSFNDQIPPYGILLLAFISTDVFYLLPNSTLRYTIVSIHQHRCLLFTTKFHFTVYYFQHSLAQMSFIYYQIPPYGILFLAFISTDVFYLPSFKFSR